MNTGNRARPQRVNVATAGKGQRIGVPSPKTAPNTRGSMVQHQKVKQRTVPRPQTVTTAWRG